MNINTKVIHGGISEDKTTGALSIPIYTSSTFRQLEPGKTIAGFEYGRTGNPTRQALETLIADLEEGAAGFAFASGLAAITTTLFLFKSGDKILTSSNIYGGTFRILDEIFKKFGLNYETVDTSNLELLENVFKTDKTIKGIIIESPSNPLLTIIDIQETAKIAKKYGALTIVDNTFLTPYLQRPLTLGADIVVHSGTKYLGGHSDVISGLVIVKDNDLAEKIKSYQNATGGVLAPMDCWILIRGIKTLAVRMDRHNENAAFIAQKLKTLEGIEKIYYPNIGGMISFELNKKYDIKKFFNKLNLIIFAESLGGVDSLICHPASMTHASIPKEIREKIGITDTLIRLSVGIEDKEEIWQDLQSALIEK